MGHETEALYLKDCYLTEWDATVASAGGEGDKQGRFIVLDRTAFYPSSGGQPCDEGAITRLSDSGTFRVVFAGKFSGRISHEVDRAGLKPGDKVHCRLDWERRYKLMRSHTAAHIISEVIHRETGAMITGNQLDVDRCRIDFSVPQFDREKLKSYEEKANGIAGQGIGVTFGFRSREDALRDPNMTKLAKGLEGLPQDVKELRIVSIGSFDCQADGGTHVRDTKEVGIIRFVDFVNKGANNRRIYFQLE